VSIKAGTGQLDVMGDRAVRIEAGCCGASAVETAVGVVHGVRGVYGLDTGAPVLVHGADQRLAATLANALTDAGHTHVWLVTRE
jgi:hypothetical protein